MTHKREGWLNHTGLNLIRIVLGSYFLAVSLGLIAGVGFDALFRPMLSAEGADFVGSFLLLVLSILFMSGLFLRTSALGLALFVFTSALADCFLGDRSPASLSLFWRDLAFVCAILLSYATLRRHDLRNASVFRTHLGFHKRDVAPRRVTVKSKRKTGVPSRRPLASERAALPAPDNLAALAQINEPTARSAQPGLIAAPVWDDGEDDVENLFLNL